jgi:ribulose-bisphosphate carboxylase large chain
VELDCAVLTLTLGHQPPSTTTATSPSLKRFCMPQNPDSASPLMALANKPTDQAYSNLDIAGASRIHAWYRLTCAPDKAHALARFIAFEQTVELPESLVLRMPQAAALLEQTVGVVEAVHQLGERTFEAHISFCASLASEQLGQLLNLLYGNVSMHEGIRLMDARFPDALLAQFSGPKHGIEGVRRLTGVYGRPLLATAIKPRGLSIEALAQLAHEFALGGGDIVKDDQNLVAANFEDFKLRVDATAKAVARANERTGKNCLYFPHLAAKSQDLDRYVEFVYRMGLKGVLACPMVLGLDRTRELTARHGLVLMAHPALTGAFTAGASHGIEHQMLLGTLFRLAGADISVFPAPGGRFDYSAEQCSALKSALTGPLAQIAPALPSPAGGMRYESIPQLAADYGQDSVFLIGGSLLAHSPDLVENTRAFQAKIGEYFAEERREAGGESISSCEFPSDFSLEHSEGIRRVLRCLPGFHWQDRTDRVYKAQIDLGFDGVRRVELVGKNGEQSDFDLRYFEIAPGGFTSLEKHLHTHVILCARGAGVLITDQERSELKAFDVAYVAPLEVHQLRNETTEPFGFFCVVDRERDRPMRP